jgi:hypothetical protein
MKREYKNKGGNWLDILFSIDGKEKKIVGGKQKRIERYAAGRKRECMVGK